MLQASLEKLLAEVDARRQKELHALCAAHLDRLKKAIEERPNPSSSASSSSAAAAAPEESPPSAPAAATAPSHPEVDDADEFWPPFRAACHASCPPKLRETALDLIQKLLAFGHLRGARFIPFQPGEDVPASAIVTTATAPHISAPSSLGTRPSSIVSQANGATAAAASSSGGGDKLQSSFPPMLIDDIVHTACVASPLLSFADNQSNAAESAVHLQIIKVLLTAVITDTCQVHEATLLKCIQACANIYLYSKSPINQGTARASLTQILHHVFTQMEKRVAGLQASRSSLEGNAVEEDGDSNIVAKTESTDDLFHPLSPGMTSLTENNPYQATEAFLADLYRRDAFLAFRFLCRLSMKVERPPSLIGGPSKQPEAASVDELSSFLLRTRSLALEMIFSILTNAGPALQTQAAFISLIRQNLTMSLSKNAIQPHLILFELSLSIFLTLIKIYRAPLKVEIEVLFSEIFLFLLDTPNSSMKQKLLVLQGLFKICSSPQILADFYLNYDCDFNCVSIFERIVQSLGKIAQSPSIGGKAPSVFAIVEDANTDSAVSGERKLRAKALRCLVAISVSLAEWMKESPGGNGTSAVAIPIGVEVDPVSSPSQHSPTSAGDSGSRNGDSEAESSISGSTTAPTIVVHSRNLLRSVSLDYSGSSRLSRAVSEGKLDDPMASAEHPDKLEKVKTKKNLVRQGIATFNENPVKGITLLREVGFLTDDANVIQFLRNTPELNKTSIGDLLGNGKENCVQLMHLFVDSFDFRSIEFVTALRRFLQTFRLPGEAQKIDRIMEKFAARYCSNNPKVFAKADVAYVLAFSIMMLNTDQHSQRLKNSQRMNKEDFIRNNRGINDNADLPPEFLGSIFDEISRNEIVMDEERTVKELQKMTSVGLNRDSTQRREIYRRELKHVEKKSQTMIRRKDKPLKPFRAATHIDHARPMLDVCWIPSLAVLNAVFEECIANEYPVPDEYHVPAEIPPEDTNSQIVDLCLMGYAELTRVACTFRMDIERDALFAALGKQTGLADLGTIKAKNIAVIRVLVFLGLTCGNLLEDSWLYVLRCISELDRWHLIGEGSRVSNILSLETPKAGSPTMAASESPSSPTPAEIKYYYARRPSLANLTRDLSSQATVIAIDRLFSNSAKLDGSSIVQFYQCLCQIAEEEVAESRIFTLQKIVEISYYNMGRIRLEWTQIWKILTVFFNNVGCHPNVTIATYAVDSLRQLGTKFLDRAELAHFNTNNEFLRPVEHIMRCTPHAVIRDLVLQSVNQMIVARSKNIQSGWKSVFVILSRTASEKNDIPLVQKAFEVLEVVANTYWETVRDFFADYATCVVEFAFVSETIVVSPLSTEPIAEGAIRLLEQSAVMLSQQGKPALGGDNEDWFYLQWFPILSGLSRIMQDSTVSQIRSRALDCFFDVLRAHGSLFSFQAGHWRTILKSVVTPLFEDLKEPEHHSATSGDADSPMTMRENVNGAIWTQTIRCLVEMYGQLFEPTHPDQSLECFGEQPDLVKILLELMVLMSCQNSDNLSQTGIIHLSHFLRQNHLRFTPTLWQQCTEAVENVFRGTIPVELMRFPVPKKTEGEGSTTTNGGTMSPIDIPHAIFKCGIHVVVLQFIRDLCLEPEDGVMPILESIVEGTPASSNNTPSSSRPLQLGGPSRFLASMPLPLRSRWLACLHASFTFANAFNDHYDLRLALWKARVVKQMPNLIKQECLAMAVYLSLLFHLYRKHGDIPQEIVGETMADVSHSILHPLELEYRRTDVVLEPLMTDVQSTLARFSVYLSEPNKYQRDLASWSLVVVLIFREILAIPWPQTGEKASTDDRKYQTFHRKLPQFFRWAISTMRSDRADVQQALMMFLERIADLMDVTNAFQ